MAGEIPPPTLMTTAAELRNKTFDFVLPDGDEADEYTSFREAIQHKPEPIDASRQLRNELWPRYFSDMKLLVEVSNPEVQRFQEFLRATEEDLIATLQRLSLTLPCAGVPDLTHESRPIVTHSVVYDITLSGGGQFEVAENHGLWQRDASSRKLVFEHKMHRADSMGHSTCSRWSSLPIPVQEWEGGHFRKAELLDLLEQLCAHELVAPRLKYSGGS